MSKKTLRNMRLTAGALALCLFAAALTTLAANYPPWWLSRGVIDTQVVTNDFAAANAGQLKHFAAKAKQEFDAALPGGAGTAVNDMVASFSVTNNYGAVNVGQLKSVASPFYNRIAELAASYPSITNACPAGMASPYPWTSTTTDDNNFAAINIGQLKYVFSFDFSAVIFNQPPVAAPDVYTVAQDGTLSIAAPGVLGNDVDPENAPLSAVVESGVSGLTLNADGSFTYTPPAGWYGDAIFTYRASDGSAQSAPATVTVHVLAPDSDFDQDGLPNDWEFANGTDPFADDSSADPDRDDLTNIEEYEYGTDPLRNDTDEDLLIDGKETRTYLTDPLLSDSDSDGRSDTRQLFSAAEDDPSPNYANLSMAVEYDDNSGLITSIALLGAEPGRTYEIIGDISGHRYIRPDPHPYVMVETGLTPDPVKESLLWLNMYVGPGRRAVRCMWFIGGDGADSDGDGLSNLYETYVLNTNPDLIDTDGNGTNDGDEDFDNDGLTNLEEYNSPFNSNFRPFCGSSNPWVADTDGDGVSDGPLAPTGLQAGPDAFPLDPAAWVDANNNGYPEQLVGESHSSPPLSLDPDTDLDGMADDWEILWFGSISAGNPNADNDRDGLRNLVEYQRNSSPIMADTDGDGWSDIVEVNTYGTDPSSATSYPVPVSVTVNYTGLQIGVIHVVAVLTANGGDWSSPFTACDVQPNCSLLLGLNRSFWIKVWIDANANGVKDAWEACGTWMANPLVPAVGGPNAATVTCADPDTDNDDMPDWWERRIVDADPNDAINTVEQVLPGDDFDGDGTSNIQEYNKGTDPTDSSSKTVSIVGTVTANDGQPGTIRVLATAREGDWTSVYTIDLAAPGAFTISGVPAPASYWIKAYRDVNGNGACESWEPTGIRVQGLLEVSGPVSAIEITLAATDADNDGLPDSWERQIVDANPNDDLTTVFHVLPGADFDGDGVSNLDEYRCGSSPIENQQQSASRIVRFAAAAQTVPGVQSTVSIQVELSSAPPQVVEGIVKYIGGSASSGADFTFSTTTVRFEPGQVLKLVEVEIHDNTQGEPHENALFKLTLASGPALVGAPNIHEITIAGDTTDTDGDGLPDWWESKYFGNPTVAVPTANPDNDGWNNLQEFINGGDPTVAFTTDTGDVLQLRVTTPMK